MRARTHLAAALGAALAIPLAACGGGGASPPALAYRLPTPARAVYDVYDTATIAIEALGQSLDLDVGSAAVYDLAFARADDGVEVTLRVTDLEATLTVPMAGPMNVDESSVSGALVFTLDRRGEATLVSAPEVDETIGQLVPPLQIANSFFPALPGTPVRIGDTWTDTISYQDGDGATSGGGGDLMSILQYSAVRDTVIAGTPLLMIAFSGTSEISQTLDMQGMEIEQATSLDIEGHVLWETQAGRMFERVTTSTGRGTVRIAVLPTDLPTRFQSVSRVRVRPE
ncbi:MAG: hypothetical protein AB7T31_09245 [Gemmatimonadales bacterium]